MRLPGDRRAMESLPLRLLIVAVVAAMSVAPAAEALESLQDRQFLSRAEAVMDRVVAAAQMLTMQGPGASTALELDLSSEGALGVARFVIGDAPGGPASNAVLLELSTGAKLVRLAQDPPASMTSEHGLGLEVGSDVFTLRMEATMSGGACVICVGVV